MKADKRTERDDKIRRLYGHRLMTKAELARYFNLSYMQISRILKGEGALGDGER